MIADKIFIKDRGRKSNMFYYKKKCFRDAPIRNLEYIGIAKGKG